MTPCHRLTARPPLLLLAAACAALGAATPRAAAPPTQVNGAYAVRVSGTYTGTGTVAVGGGKNVNLNLTLTDVKTGQVAKLVAHLDMVNNRFHGTATVFGQTLEFVGRVDPPDGTTVKVARLQCTFAPPGGATGPAGRIVGQRKGGGTAAAAD